MLSFKENINSTIQKTKGRKGEREMKGLKKFATILMAGMLMATMSMPVAAASATQATVKIDSAEEECPEKLF